MQYPTINQENDANVFIPAFPPEELNDFIDDMFANFISSDDYDAYVGRMRSKHLRMYQYLKSNLMSKKLPLSES